ncbi:uncharacterized protein UDID_17813 [Ustilago sp. UG-2017a]|nr:uncharacterized protein UDID_17813 [Ustilago sp. UG-2017a]
MPLPNHSERIESLEDQVRSLLAALNARNTQEPSNDSASARQGCRSKEPEAFTGERGHLEPFLAQVDVFLRLNPGRFINDSDQILWLSTLLRGVAHQWFYPHLSAVNPPAWLTDYPLFINQLRVVFGDPDHITTAKREIEVLSQTTSVANYLTQFRQLQMTLNWGEDTMAWFFYRGLKENVKDDLSCSGKPTNLETLIQRSLEIDNHIAKQISERKRVITRSANPTPMPVSNPPIAPTTIHPSSPSALRAPLTTAGKLDPEEYKRRQANNLCIYCASSEHVVTDYLRFVTLHSLPLTSKPLTETLLLTDGKTQVIISKEVQLSCLVAELFPSDITFQVTDLGLCPIILGLPWLKGANPSIDWKSGNITMRSPPLTPSLMAPSQPSPTLPSASLAIDVIDAIAFDQSLQSDCLTSGTLYPSPVQSQHLLATTTTSADTTMALAYDAGLPDIIPQEYHQYLDVLSEHELKTLREYLEENLAKGFISPSDSLAASPILFVKKKDGSLCLCVDYRGLNRITIRNRYPLPLIDELLDRLREARFFTRIDLRGAYNLLHIAKGDEWKMAFHTRYGLFQYNVMPFGLTNTPASFQHLMNDTFKDMLDRSLIIYLDDLLIYSSTLKQHQEHVSAVLARLRQAGLYAKAEKCQFSTSQTKFLGFVVSDQGVAMDPSKTEVITNWPVPKSVHDVQVFLGFCNFYRKFIPQYSRTAYPLTQLLRKEAQSAPFAWHNDAQHAFEQLHSAFGTDTILHHFDPTRPIIVETDASDFAVAAVLSQTFDQGARHPIAFFSKKLEPAQLNYTIFDKEMFAIVAAFKHWRQYLEGAKFQVQVLTNHRSLEYFTTTKQLNRRQACWSELLADFDFVIQYRPGAQAGLPDALTRRSNMRPKDRGPSLMQEHNPGNFQTLLKPHQLRLAATGILTVKSDITDKIRDALPRDPWTSSLLEQVHLGSAPPGFAINSMNLLTYQDSVCVPEVDDLRLLIVQDRHDSPAAGHPGRRKTLSLVRRSFFWLGMSKFVHSFVDSCETCRRIKAVWHKPYGHLKSLLVPPHPWSSISMDLIEQLPPSSDFTAILIVVDRLTKMAIFVPTTNELDAPKLAKLFLRHVYSKHGLPTSIVSDRGSEFASHFWRSLSTLLGIENHFSSAYHPQSDGQTERINQVLEQFLRGYSNHLQTDWSNLLPLAEFSYNNAEHASTQLTPFFANYGRMDSYVQDQEEEASIMAECSKPVATLFPKFNPRDIEIYILEAEAWFRFNQVHEHTRMINHLGSQLEGTAREWWTSKLRFDRAREGRLFNDWQFFTKRLAEQFNPQNARMEAYNKLLALRLTSNAPGAATRHVEQFRDLEGQVNLGDNELTIDLFRGSLTRSIQEKFERNPPKELWEWFREVKEIDRQRMLLQQASARHLQANNAVQFPFGDRLRNLIQLDHRLNLIDRHNLIRPDTPPNPSLTQTTVLFPINLLQLRKEPRHHQEAATTPAMVDSLGSRPMGPKVMVVTKDPFDEATDSGDGHSGNTEPEQEDMDLWPYQQHMDSDHEDKQDDDDDEGNVRKAVLELSGMVQNHPARILADTGAGLSIVSDSFISKYQIPTKPTKTRSIHGVTGHQLCINSSASMQVSIGTHNLGVVEASVADTADYDLILGFTELRKLKPTIQWDTGQLEFKTQEQDRPPKRPPEAARAGDLTMRRPTLHGNEFVSAERILRAALEDGPIGFMLLEEPPSSLPAFGFVPTGADKEVEMEVEVDKEVTTADIPKPYQHLRDVFDEVEADKLPHHTEHDLHLELIEGGKPPQGPLYLKGPKEMSELRRYLDENLEKGFIRPSKSPARSPVLFVPKKDGGLRLCVDYRGLNEITVKNRAPLPLIEEQLFLLRKARIYTKLDLRAAYNLIQIAKGDEWKTAFGTQLGLYEYLVMPFGLANAPAHFQSFINDIFRDIIGVYVVVYLDDFLIFSDTEESHVKHVTEVLTRLRSNRLFAKLSKCEFHTKTVEFLGYIIKPTGIEMDPEKVRTVKEWPMPASIHDIQRFLGFANFYRRFIAHFARIAKPLTSLVKPTERFRKFELPKEAQQAFQQLIQAFTSAGVCQGSRA